MSDISTCILSSMIGTMIAFNWDQVYNSSSVFIEHFGTTIDSLQALTEQLQQFKKVFHKIRIISYTGFLGGLGGAGIWNSEYKN